MYWAITRTCACCASPRQACRRRHCRLSSVRPSPSFLRSRCCMPAGALASTAARPPATRTPRERGRCQGGCRHCRGGPGRRLVQALELTLDDRPVPAAAGRCGVLATPMPAPSSSLMHPHGAVQQQSPHAPARDRRAGWAAPAAGAPAASVISPGVSSRAAGQHQEQPIQHRGHAVAGPRSRPPASGAGP